MLSLLAFYEGSSSKLFLDVIICKPWILRTHYSKLTTFLFFAAPSILIYFLQTNHGISLHTSRLLVFSSSHYILLSFPRSFVHSCCRSVVLSFPDLRDASIASLLSCLWLAAYCLLPTYIYSKLPSNIKPSNFILKITPINAFMLRSMMVLCLVQGHQMER